MSPGEMLLRSIDSAPADDGLIYGRTPPRRKGFRLSDHPRLVQGAIAAALLATWEVYGRSLNPILLSYPTAVARAFVELALNGQLLRALGQSLQPLAAGFFLAVIVGVVVGLLMGRYKLLHEGLDPFLTALYATPSVALIPLIMLWFGFGFAAKVVIVFLSCFFAIVINTYAGVRDVSRASVDVVRAYGANDRQIMTKVILPSAVPFVMAGIRVAVGRGVIGMVVAEFFTALTGLGALIIVYSNAFATAKLFVPILVLSALGVGLTAVARRVELLLAPWKETERAG
ncbi:MAG TPA: ABC transporter permease [bacterium]|nr:ABC transporter permease [bacterium]